MPGQEHGQSVVPAWVHDSAGLGGIAGAEALRHSCRDLEAGRLPKLGSPMQAVSSLNCSQPDASDTWPRVATGTGPALQLHLLQNALMIQEKKAYALQLESQSRAQHLASMLQTAKSYLSSQLEWEEKSLRDAKHLADPSACHGFSKGDAADILWEGEQLIKKISIMRRSSSQTSLGISPQACNSWAQAYVLRRHGKLVLPDTHRYICIKWLQRLTHSLCQSQQQIQERHASPSHRSAKVPVAIMSGKHSSAKAAYVSRQALMHAVDLLCWHPDSNINIVGSSRLLEQGNRLPLESQARSEKLLWQSQCVWTAVSMHA